MVSEFVAGGHQPAGGLGCFGNVSSVHEECRADVARAKGGQKLIHDCRRGSVIKGQCDHPLLSLPRGQLET